MACYLLNIEFPLQIKDVGREMCLPNKNPGTQTVMEGKILDLGLRYGLWLVLILYMSGHAYGYGLIEKVSTFGGPDGTVVEVGISGYSNHKVIPVGKTEILVAFKDTHVAEDVYAREAIIGDDLIREIEVAERPFDVASLVLKLRRPDRVLDLEVQVSKGVWRIQIKPTEETSKDTSDGPTADEAVSRGGSIGETGGQQDTASVSKRDCSPDGALFQQGLKSQETGEWDQAIALYDKIIRVYPRSPHLENSYFRAADATYSKFREQTGEHLVEISRRYQRAINRFPESDHVPKAMLSLGDVYVRSGQYFEAITYYDSVLKHDVENNLIAEALFNKGKAFALTQRPLMALRVFEEVIAGYGTTPFAGQAKLEMAKTLYGMKSFKRSLGILDELVAQYPDMIYQDADVLLYTAYNHYELGRLEAARNAFSKVINYFPDAEEHVLILARIADTFREEGLEEKAAKLYSLVARTYPSSEAGVISLLRLAEIAEEQEANASLKLSEEIVSESTTKTASHIYSQIINEYPESPLSRVAMLKLASLQKREKEYAKCVETLKELLAKHPETRLKDQVEKVLRQAMVQIAVGEREKGNHEKSVETIATVLEEYPNTRFDEPVLQGLEKSLVHVLQTKKTLEGAEGVINYYEDRRDLVLPARMPEVSQIVGLAYKEMYLCDYALSILSKAREAYTGQELPPDHLLNLGECGYRQEKYGLATEVLTAFISTYPDHAGTSSAHLWLGNISMAEAKYDQALQVFKRGLEQTKEKEDRARLLAAMGKALNGKGDHKKAIDSLTEVLRILESGGGGDVDAGFMVNKELGETYFKLGKNEEAIEAFERALKLKPKEINRYGLQFEIAKCYQSIAPRKAQDVLNEIVASGDPFWSKVAQARIDEINVEQSVGRLGLSRS